MTKNKKNILVIGANGLVGSSLSGKLSEKNINFTGTYNKRSKKDFKRLDITSWYDLNKCFYEVRPTCVINSANLAGGVDFCENNPDIAEKFHFESVKNMVKMCNELKSKFIFISSDYIFDGENGPYREDDVSNPLNLYGKLKLKAEEYIKDNMDDYLIIRTTNIYGFDPKTVTPNYMMNLYFTLNENKTFNAPSFLWGNPTYVDDLTDAILELNTSDARGVFHIVGSSFIDRFSWAKMACEIFGFDKNLIKEIVSPNANMISRPLKSNLNSEKFTNTFKTVLNDVETGLNMMKEQIIENG